MAIDLDRFAYFPFLVTESNKDKSVAVETHAKQVIERLIELCSQIVEASLDLLNNLLTAG